MDRIRGAETGDPSMVKAILVAALGGMFSGHFVRNGWRALFLMLAFVGLETTLEGAHHHWSEWRHVGAFGVLDTVGSGALLVSEALSV